MLQTYVDTNAPYAVNDVKKQPPLLCCLVNAVGKCNVCKKVKCSDHSFNCGSCSTVCHDCGVVMECTKCSEHLCGKCMKSGTIGEKVCPYCYAEEYDGYYPNLSEDEWDR